MAKKSLRYLLQRIRQIIVLSIGVAIFIGLCFASLSIATTNSTQDDQVPQTMSATATMQVLLTPSGIPIDKCLMPKPEPVDKDCKPFVNIDEGVLQDLLRNYTKCIEDSSFNINFSNQPIIKLTKSITIFGRTDNPLTITGLKLVPDENFPKDAPALIVYGRSVELKDISLDGFKTGILYASKDNHLHKLIGGRIHIAKEDGAAITACNNLPDIAANVNFSGYSENVSIIE